MDDSSYPYSVCVWYTDKQGQQTISYWKELARCETVFRFEEVATLLIREYKFVRVSRFENGRFIPYAYYPNQRAVEQNTVADAQEPV